MMAAGFSMTNRDKHNWRWNTSLPEINSTLFGIEKGMKKLRSIYVNVRPRPVS